MCNDKEPIAPSLEGHETMSKRRTIVTTCRLMVGEIVRTESCCRLKWAGAAFDIAVERDIGLQVCLPRHLHTSRTYYLLGT
jgi:hypothetical protein